MGPWSRSFLAAVVGNAERPDLEVTNLRIEPGLISGTVDGCEVTLSATPIAARTWESVARFAKGMGALEDAVQGRVQSVHLEHLLEEDWEEQLVPRPGAIWKACSCDEPGYCVHQIALAFAVADDIERAPLVLIRWRGVGGRESTVEANDPWDGHDVQLANGPRPMPRYAVLRRLGSSTIARETDELTHMLRVAYEQLSSAPRD